MAYPFFVELPMNQNPKIFLRLLPALCCLTLTLGGCASTGARQASQLPTLPSDFREGHNALVGATPAAVQPEGRWWRVFADPVLDDLIERATRANTTIAVAAARLEQARALLQSADAARMPQLGLGAGASRQGGPLVNAAGTEGTLTRAIASASWVPDLFGRLRQASAGAALDVRSQEALLRSTRLLVQAQVAQTYISLRALEAERALVRTTVLAFDETLRISARRLAIGSIAEVDLIRVQAEASAFAAEGLALERRSAEMKHALAVLTGEVASVFNTNAGGTELLLPVIPPGVPSAVLARRPDVDAARNTLQAAQVRVGLAESAWLPALSLTASGGYASSALGDLFKLSMRAWGVGALLSMPLIDNGSRAAGIRNASAEFDAAAALYRQQILVAFKDVEDHLSALRILADVAQEQARTVSLAGRAVALSRSRFRSGLASRLELLDAERAELRSRRMDLQVRAARYQATVGLVQALGGSWDALPLSPG